MLGIEVNGIKYTTEELLKIVEKHQIEEDKRMTKCFRCGSKFLENKKFNMCEYNLNYQNISGTPAFAEGYYKPPMISGFEITSTCGQGRKINLCDDCVSELIDWLSNISIPSQNCEHEWVCHTVGDDGVIYKCKKCGKRKVGETSEYLSKKMNKNNNKSTLLKKKMR